MAERIPTVEDIAMSILHQVGTGARVLHSHHVPLINHAREIREVLEKHSFNRFTNWGLRTGDEELSRHDANWFLRTYTPKQQVEFERRIAGIDRASLLTAIEGFCQERYRSRVRSLLVFGGYLYGITERPDDLDLIVVLKKSKVVENDVAFNWDGLNSTITYTRKPVSNKIGLSVIGAGQINGTTQNNSVLRTAIIAGTTGVSLFGPPYQIRSVPVAVMLYHAIEMVTWGFKLCFEASEQAHDRALWRLIEAVYILKYINDAIEGPLPSLLPYAHVTSQQLSGMNLKRRKSLDVFLSSFDQFRRDVFTLKVAIRQRAIELLDMAIHSMPSD